MITLKQNPAVNTQDKGTKAYDPESSIATYICRNKKIYECL